MTEHLRIDGTMYYFREVHRKLFQEFREKRGYIIWRNK